MALGDSYTIGTNAGQSDRWPDQLVETLRDSVPLELIANLGVNGYTSGDLVQRELPQLADLRPEFVSLLIGVNDVVQDVPIERYRANVEQTLADRSGSCAARPSRHRERPGLHADAARRRLRRSPATARRDRGREHVDASRSLPTAAWRSWTSPPSRIRLAADAALVASDKLHPSGEQYRRWVELIAPVVEGLLGG